MTWSIIPSLDFLGSFKFMQLTNLETPKQGNGRNEPLKVLNYYWYGCWRVVATIKSQPSPTTLLLKHFWSHQQDCLPNWLGSCSEGSCISIQTYYYKPAFTSLQTSEPWDEIADDKEEIWSHMETIPCTLIGWLLYCTYLYCFQMHANIAMAKNTNTFFNGNKFIAVFLLSISINGFKMQMPSDYHLWPHPLALVTQAPSPLENCLWLLQWAIVVPSLKFF